jgi:hypothetical protein
MRAIEFITESKTVEYEGLTLKISKNGHQLMVNALDDWGNKVLGQVRFNIGDGKELDPQDLAVDDKYQGQGIAKVMYDYVKSLGYTIVRSYDQTDAGAGFWNKHRGEDVRIWEARAGGKLNRKYDSARREVKSILNSPYINLKEWGLSMTMLPKLGINPGKGISEDTPKGIYFYPLAYVNDWVNGSEELPWGNDFPYIQVFQYDTSHRMTPDTKVDPERLKATLRQYCPEEVINQLIEEGTYNNDPYWFIYNCLIQVSKNDESTIIRWNKILRDLGFTSVYDYGKGWIAHNEPEQGIILDPRIIKQVQTFNNYTRKQGVAEDDDKLKDPIVNAVIDFYQHVGKIHKDPIDDYVSTAKEMLGHVDDPKLKSKLLDIFKQAKQNPYVQGGVVTTIGALLAGGVLSSAQKMGLSPSQTNLALQAILNTVIPTVVSRINGKSWSDTIKYTLASAGIGTGIAGMMDEARGLAPTKPYDDLMANMGYFMSLNTVKIQQDAVDGNAQQELANMQQQFRKPILNGMSFFDVNRDVKLSKNPKVAPILLKYVYDMLGYIEPRIKKYIKPEQQGKYLDRLDQIKNDYRAAVAQVS